MNYRALVLATAFAAASSLGATAALAKKGDAKVRDDGLISQQGQVHLFEHRAATSVPPAVKPDAHRGTAPKQHKTNGQ